MTSSVTLFPNMFPCRLRLSFPRLVHKVLHHLGLTPTQLYFNAWWILICCCILWRFALLKSDLEHAEFTYCKFLLTHNVKRGAGDICSFRAMSSFVVLEQWYRKVPDWTGKSFFGSGHGWELLVGQINRTEFPIRALWGVVPSNKVVRLTATLDELCHIALLRSGRDNAPFLFTWRFFLRRITLPLISLPLVTTSLPIVAFPFVCLLRCRRSTLRDFLSRSRGRNLAQRLVELGAISHPC